METNRYFRYQGAYTKFSLGRTLGSTGSAKIQAPWSLKSLFKFNPNQKVCRTRTAYKVAPQADYQCPCVKLGPKYNIIFEFSPSLLKIWTMVIESRVTPVYFLLLMFIRQYVIIHIPVLFIEILCLRVEC